MKKAVYFIVAIIGLAAGLYAGGSKDISTVEMTSLESWQEPLDISGKKKGKYNILITAKDLAGNEGYYGPFNMYIDPNSDLPIVHISSPMDDSCIVGNVNIVGTCIDDDAVAYVELKIDNGEEVYRAKGKEFWSYYINTKEFEEGKHTIEAWGVDINGVRGKSVKTSFHLDRHQPETNIQNKAVGELVSGKISLEGIVEDGNGIERLLYSLDDGVKFENINLSYNKRTGKSSFKLNINTKTIPDGPKICWFKAIDKQGSIGIYTFLFFVDNTAPTVEFVYPEEDSGAQGSIFSVAGKAFDTVGLESLTWRYGKESGEFEIKPGNKYWVKEFNFAKENIKSVLIEIIAKDAAGNVVSAKRTVEIDKTKDMPVVNVASPRDGSQIVSDLFISGIAYDLYGASEIRYKIDKGEEKTYNTEFGAFGLTENNIAAGEHTLTVYAVNKYGVSGKPVTVKFTAGGAAPSILFENNETVIPVYDVKSKVSTAIHVFSSAGLKYVSASFNEEEETPVQIKAGQTEYIIRPAINAKSEPGIYTVSVTATDMQDRTARQKLVVGVVSSAGSSGSENFVWAKGNTTDAGSVILLDGKPISGVYQPNEGAAIESVEVVGGSGFSAEVDGNEIKLSSLKDGLFKGVGVKITDTNGSVYTSPLIDIYSDMSVPVLSLETPQEPSFVKNSIALKGSVSDGAGVKSVSYSMGGDSPFVPIGTSFNEIINITSQEDGLIVVTIKAEDKAGREMTEHRIFYKDTAAPEAAMVEPVSGDKVNGSIYAAFKVNETFPHVKAEYRGGGKNSQWQEFEYNTLPHIIIGTPEDPVTNNMQFRFTDLAGNARIFNNYTFLIDNSVDIPVVELHLPADNEVIFKDFEISGIVYDDDAPAKLYYKIDNEAYRSMDIKNTFSIPMLLTDLTDNEHTITVYGEDIYGVKSEPVSRKIRVSLNLPVSAVTSPSISETVKGVVSITGTATDKNGIQQVEISIDNGNTFSLTEGKEEWSYTVNTTIIDDGTHVVFVRTTDNYGRQSLFSSLINIDNTPPVLKFEYPLSGSKLDSHLFVSGQTMDNISLEGVTLKIKSLSGGQVPAKLAEMKLDTTLLTSKDIDISSLAEGRYNLEISGVDKASNVSEVSVNFDVYRKKDKERIDLLYPLNGETVRGEFNIYGKVIAEKEIASATLYIDGKQVESSEISKTNYAAFKMNPENITDGVHKIEIKCMCEDGKVLVSNIHTVKYETVGPWITIDNFAMGDFAIERPYLKGRAGYTVSDEEIANVNSKFATAEEKYLFKGKKLKKVEISFDNGKTFVPAKIKKGWQYRIETEDLHEGNHFLLVRATMENKEVAICRTIIKVDKTAPEIVLISPGTGGRYNNSIEFTGLSSDDIELVSVEAALRKGDKSSYGVPKFIQGLHFEAAFWGASLWNMGIGLSFFDDNVKIQLHYGHFLQSQYNVIHGKEMLRYGGHIFTLKLLANIVDIPFGYYFGPDWKWLHFNMAFGAQFSLFTKTQSNKPQILSALLAQVEFPRVRLPKRKYFRSFSFFTEGQLWFIPTDVNSTKVVEKKKKGIKSIIPHISCGIRVYVF